MKKLNVISLGEFKERRQLKKSEDSYTSYLQTLANSQLEIEVDALLEEFSEDSYGSDFFTKGQLVLKEIAHRAHGSVKKKIEAFTSEVKSRL